MFNRTTNNYESKVVAITKEIEKTISPDKVTDMYDAIRDEVEKNIIRRVYVSDNVLNGVVMEISHDNSSNMNELLFRCTINGREHIGREKVAPETMTNAVMIWEKFEAFYLNTMKDELMKTTAHLIPKEM